MTHKPLKLNAQKRKLGVNVFKKHYQNEDNILRTAYYEKRKIFDNHIENAHKLVKEIVNRKYPSEDIATLKPLQEKHNFDVVRQDNCFHFRSDTPEKKSRYDGQEYEDFPECHVKFELFSGTQRHDYNNDNGKKFAYAYYHDHLKNKGLTPEVFELQGDKKDNPHHDNLKKECSKELCGQEWVGNNNEHIGLSKEWNDKYTLDVIGGNHYCNSRYIECTENEFKILKDFLNSKEQLVDAYISWQENIVKRVKVVEDTLKNYNTFDQMKKLADNQKVEISENSITIECTDLAIFNPDNVSAMLDDLKPKAKETKAEKLQRIYGINSSGVQNAQS